MKAMLCSHPLDKAKQFIDIATEFVTVFLDKHEQTLDEKDLEKLESVAHYHRERAEDIQNIHNFYKERLEGMGGKP